MEKYRKYKKYEYRDENGRIILERTVYSEPTNPDDNPQLVVDRFATEDKRYIPYGLDRLNNEKEEIYVYDDLEKVKGENEIGITDLKEIKGHYHIFNRKKVLLNVENENLKKALIHQIKKHSFPREIRDKDTIYFQISYKDINLSELLIKGVPEREYIDPLWKIPKGVVALIGAIGSTGKGMFLIWNTLRWMSMGHNVCYITAEDDIQEIERRTLQILGKMKDFDHEKVTGKLRVYDISDSEDFVEVVKFQIDEGFNIIIVDPFGFLIGDENQTSEASKIMRTLQHLSKSKGINVILSHHLTKYKLKDAKSKWDMIEAVRGSGGWTNNSRYVWIAKRNKEDNNLIEIWNCKNSYGSNRNDYIIHNILPELSGDLTIEKIEMNEKGETVRVERPETKKPEEPKPKEKNDDDDEGIMF